MNKAILFNFLVDKEKNQITVDRSFNAPLDLVWAAWTEAELLDQWWAPKPYQAITKSQDFRVGGKWLYHMLGPTGDKHWCYFIYEKIEPMTYFGGHDSFCDEHGNANTSKPIVHWGSTFNDQGDSTLVNIVLQFKSFEDLEMIIQMGFKEGFTAGLENLDHYISTQFYLRQRSKPNNKARVSTYVNFPGNTEEAFLFYRAAFKTEFVDGIHRFGELPADPNQPPMSESLKKMVIHVELPLPGGHILMGTDAPKEMGFTVTQGNNMHINLEPDSKAEADRLFIELSAGGVVSMPMQDMFWGAYFGSFTDKYGINWMVNFQTKQ